MRRFRFTLTPEEGGFSTTDQRMRAAPAVSRKAILHLDLLRDGSAMAIYLLSGDPDALAAVLADAPEVRSFHPFNTDGEQFHVHLHFEPDDPLLSLLELGERYLMVTEPPVEFVNDGQSTRITIGGVQEQVQGAADDFPDGVEVTVEQIGEYDPSRNSLLGALTERQREVLAVAIGQGYYDIPRRATHEDLAENLDCSAGTVGEHLRKIEARVLSSLLG
jgi:DNA-binding CsgD family transcriptional regulator